MNPMHGKFFWVNSVLLDKATEPLTRSEKTKFLMLCTFLDGDGRINLGASDISSGVADILDVT